MAEISADLVILSNGPGELSTWVRPVLQALMAQPRFSRVSILLSPCPHAGGNEVTLAAAFPGVDRVLAPQQFFFFLLWGKTPNAWQWHQQGVVVFLGGDQFYAVAIGRRLGYRIVTYAEWTPRWLPWLDHCGVAQPQILQKVPRRYRSKITVVGHLMADIQPDSVPLLDRLGWTPETEIVGLLPGSKPAKLRVGMPFCLAIADQLHPQRPQTQFVIPVAPGVTTTSLIEYASQNLRPLDSSVSVSQHQAKQGLVALRTQQGTPIWLWTESPAYPLLKHCQVCVTTVGANTAELAALAVPMLVLIPTQYLDAMRAWDGLLGVIANAPWVGKFVATFVNRITLWRGLGLRAWPNIWAQEEIVPEYVGHIHPDDIAQRIDQLLKDPARLHQLQANLRTVCGEQEAITRFVQLIYMALENRDMA
ncbi:lipid-A-disaccharide synthase [Acaryochloris sp. IP29b_bin.137]|uniref:lipid-A-disaccharide synthase n=1 Tax=Acaryochloris sp. IP29b_bin.137 TaxID=2969217 RepID=UPI00262801F6|nr:lipid-A-disaccharide synthase [Acaryochloris sp. IP29b_bin.137]